jgi:peptidyl-prolyl cis-trans isomerase D
MLNTLRNSAQGILAKIILILLIGSFILWGIGDIFRQGGGAGTIATVGRTPISTQEFQNAVHRRQEELRQMLGANYKPELLKRLGIENQVVFNLINHLVIEKETSSLGIEVGEEDVRDAIRNNPNFQDSDGHFNKSLYMETLKNNGLAEQRYVTDIRKDIAAKLLTDMFISSVIVNEDVVQALYNARAEQRSADIIIVPASGIKSALEPEEKELKDYYNTHEKSFFSPEYRTFSYVELTPEDIQNKIDVPESDIKRVYEERMQEFHKPEHRIVKQLLFQEESDAQKASSDLTNGAHFTDIAKSAPILNKDKLLLGTVSKTDMLPEASEEVFSLKVGATSKPIHSAFGWHIFMVEKVEPETTLPLAKVHADIAKELAVKITQETVYKMANTLEDALAGGSTLENAVEKIGQKVYTVGPIMRNGVTANGKKIALPTDENFLAIAFATNEKDHSQATQMSDGGYFLLQVDNVAPEHLKPFADVKNDIIAAWKEEKKHTLLKQTAEDIVSKLRKGTALPEALANQPILASSSASGKLKHDSKKIPEGKFAGKNISPEIVSALFRLKPHENTSAYMIDGNYMIAVAQNIFPVQENKNTKAPNQALDIIRTELKTAQATEKLHYYMSYLRSKYHVSINESAFAVKEDETRE